MLEILIVIFPGVIATLAYYICNCNHRTKVSSKDGSYTASQSDFKSDFNINRKRLAALILFYIVSINLCILGGLYMIGMHRFNLFDMSLRFKVKWLILEFALGVIITLIYWNASMVYRQKLSISKHIRKLIPALFFLNVTYTIFTPSSLFLGNINEFSIPYIKIVPIIITASLLLTVIVYITALCFTNEKTAVYSMAVIFAVSLGAYIQGNFLNPTFPALDGTWIKWSSL